MFERIISILRSIAFVGAMAFIFMIVGLNADATNNVATILFLAAIIYVILEICGILYRCIRAGKARTEEQQKFIMMFFFNNRADISVTDSLRRIAGLGIIAIIVCAVLGKPVGDLLSSQYTGFSLAQLFSAYLKWSIIAFPIIVMLSVLKLWYIMPHLGEGAYSMGTLIIKKIGSDLASPINNVRMILSSEKKAVYGVKSLISIALIVFVVLGIMSL